MLILSAKRRALRYKRYAGEDHRCNRSNAKSFQRSDSSVPNAGRCCTKQLIAYYQMMGDNYEQKAKSKADAVIKGNLITTLLYQI